MARSKRKYTCKQFERTKQLSEEVKKGKFKSLKGFRSDIKILI